MNKKEKDSRSVSNMDNQTQDSVKQMSFFRSSPNRNIDVEAKKHSWAKTDVDILQASTMINSPTFLQSKDINFPTSKQS